ncbi:MAG: cytochrome c family protein [Hyphomonadaceae bacterium]
MSDLGFNKIAFCVLGTGLALIGLNEAAHAMFHHSEHANPGYYVEVEEAGAGGPAVVEGPRDYGTLLLTADLAKGEEQHKKCLQCHNFDQGGPNLQGPNLYGVLGRKIGSHEGFKYSTGAGSITEKGADGTVWDYEHLDHFLERPKGYASATLMNFAGINSRITGVQDRINLIAFLRSNGSSSVPLPAPLPATSAAAPAGGPASPDGTTAPPGAMPAPADGSATPGGAPAAPVTPTPAPQH